jgi:predicted permease
VCFVGLQYLGKQEKIIRLLYCVLLRRDVLTADIHAHLPSISQKSMRFMMNWKILGSSISAAILLGALFLLSFQIGDSKAATAMNIVVIVFGVSGGWLLGIVVSPYSKKEQSRFTALSKAVAVFGSGYAVGKIDKLIEKLLDPTLVLESVHGFRLLSAASALLLALIVTFVYRQYARGKPGGHGRDDDDDDDDDGKDDDGTKKG